MVEPEWKTVEWLVALLEKFLNPEESSVTTNERIPVLGKPSRERKEFDVVIRQRVGPRTHMIVFEIQNRSRRIGIDSLDKWLKKMESVGANKLVCVSTKGYTKDAISAAKEEYGGRVDLLTFNDLKPLASIETFVALPVVVDVTGFEIEDIQLGNLAFGYDDKLGPPKEDPNTSIELDEKLIAIGEENNLVSVFDALAQLHHDNLELIYAALVCSQYRFTKTIGVADRWGVKIGDELYPILHWEIQATLRPKKVFRRLKVEQAYYSTVIEENTLAWTARYIGTDRSIVFATKTTVLGLETSVSQYEHSEDGEKKLLSHQIMRLPQLETPVGGIMRLK